MLTSRIVVCLDVKDGQLVKGIRFKDLRTLGSPAEFAADYEAQGADEIVMLDISAGKEGRLAQLQVVQSIRKRLSIPLTVGGGIRTLEDAAQLLEHGADKVSVNSAALRNPELISQISDQFGKQCAVLSLDAVKCAGGWKVAIRSGEEVTERDAIDWAKEGQSRGAGEVLLTSRDCDGTQAGYDYDLIAAISNAVTIPVVASGGASSAGDMAQAFFSGASASLAASIFHNGTYTVGQVKQYLSTQGIKVRL